VKSWTNFPCASELLALSRSCGSDSPAFRTLCAPRWWDNSIACAAEHGDFFRAKLFTRVSAGTGEGYLGFRAKRLWVVGATRRWRQVASLAVIARTRVPC
jgi:hypothetical protein